MAVSLTLALFTMAGGGSPAAAAEPPVNMGTTGSFSVVGGSTVTNTGPSVIDGDLGLHPGTSITGFPPGTVNGTIHATDAVALQAQSDLTTAYNDAAGRGPGAAADDLVGRTLVAGVYSGPTLSLSGTLTLDGEGDPNAVFIFQSASTLITASNSTVAFTNGAQACNVFWQVGSSATLGTGSTFVGSVLALTSISAGTGATVDGRLLARNGAVTLDSNVITASTCSTSTPTATATPTTPTDTGSPTSPTDTASPTSPTGTGTPTNSTGSPRPIPSVSGPGLPRSGA